MSVRSARSHSHALLSGRRARMPPDPLSIEVTLFHDVLCAWSYLAFARLSRLRDELGGAVRLSCRGFPLRPEEQALEKKERQAMARTVRKIAKEPEGQGAVADLWTGSDPPASSLPPLLALEAARLQGEEAHEELHQVLRRAAFLRGVNVTRRDVLLELAGRTGLDEERFLHDLDGERPFTLLQEGVLEAEAVGIRGVPAVLIGGEWLMQGCREVGEYGGVIEKYLSERTAVGAMRVVH
jgi:predicted DsbA family dithiol-disulfide isomerase